MSDANRGIAEFATSENRPIEPRQTLTPTIGVEEAGQLLRCHPDTVRKMAKTGELPGTKVGRAWVFYTERLLEWLDARCETQTKAGATNDLTGGAALAARLAGDRGRRQRSTQGHLHTKRFLPKA